MIVTGCLDHPPSHLRNVIEAVTMTMSHSKPLLNGETSCPSVRPIIQNSQIVKKTYYAKASPLGYIAFAMVYFFIEHQFSKITNNQLGWRCEGPTTDPAKLILWWSGIYGTGVVWHLSKGKGGRVSRSPLSLWTMSKVILKWCITAQWVK